MCLDLNLLTALQLVTLAALAALALVVLCGIAALLVLSLRRLLRQCVQIWREES